jgi:two-component system sensor histidine kinase VicK
MEILAHDLKGPIAIIQSFASLIEKRMSAFQDLEIVEWLKLIQETCGRSIELIRSFVNSEFLESANIVLSRDRLDLVWEIGQVIDSYKKSEKTIAKVFEFTASHRNIYAEVDSMKFLQVINNLISNAIKFTHNNGHIHLHIEEKQGTDGIPASVLISVRDNGIGIPASDQPYLFDKFTKARRPGLKGEESVGLGMFIIKTIVELHQGKIWLESAENKGTTFFIEIPREK